MIELNLPKEIRCCLEYISDIDFDIFELKEYTYDNELFTIMQYLFHRGGMIDRLHIPDEAFASFIKLIQENYRASN
jgi:hypothetical protein